MTKDQDNKFVFYVNNLSYKSVNGAKGKERWVEGYISTDDLDLVNDITAFTKRVPKLPDFVLDGIILGVQGGLDKVLGYLNQALEAGVKVSGLWCQDWAGIKYTTFGKRLFWDWKLNKELYPNLEEKIKELDKENIAFLTYICPFILENESLFNEANDNNFLAYNRRKCV